MNKKEIDETLFFAADVQRFYCDNVSKSVEYKDDKLMGLDDLFHILEENFDFLSAY